MLGILIIFFVSILCIASIGWLIWLLRDKERSSNSSDLDDVVINGNVTSAFKDLFNKK